MSRRFEMPSSPEEEPIGDRVPTPDSDEEDVLMEPRFKYEFVAGPDATQMLQHHVLTSVAVHDKLIAVGTQTGYVWVMDHAGYTDHSTIPTVRPHRTAVTRLAMDSSGNYVISCANDGRVAITGLGTTLLNHVLSLKFMPRSIALSPDFSKIKATPYFIVGERNLVLYEKGLFNYKESVIFRGGEKDGFISKIACQNNHIAFINDGGTRIYDKTLEKMITLLNPSHDVDRVRSSRFPPTLCWLADDSLAVGWADTVTILVIVEEHNSVATSKRAEIHFSWNLEGLYCSGISSVLNAKGCWKEIVIFGLRPDTDEDDSRDFCDGASMVSVESALLGPPPRVQICVLQPDDFKNYELVAEDTLDMQARGGAQPCQFQMEGLPSCDSYFLLAPTQLVTATPYSALDTVNWRIANKKYEDAWELAREKASELEGTEADQHTVGRQMIEHLLYQQKARMAVSKLKEVCGDLQEEWQWAVTLFEKSALCTLLSDVLPTESPQLEPECYEAVLHAALYNDTKLYKKLVHRWSGDLFRVGSLTSMTIHRIHDSTEAAKGNIENYTYSILTKEEENCLYSALAHLYVYERKFDRAIKIYIGQKDLDIFNVINKYQLFDVVKDQISDLMTINTNSTLSLLLQNEDSVSPKIVMAQIVRQPKTQLAYLKKLFGKNEGAEYADQAVRLMADHDTKGLLQFLRTNENYHIIRALDICRGKGFTEEMILLHGKSGNHREALELILRNQNRLDKAIDYCKEHDDKDLWEALINEVLKRPDHISTLLTKAGSSVNPLKVIKQIPLDVDVPGLRDAIDKVLRDCVARVEVLRGCTNATQADTNILMKDFLHCQIRTFSVRMRTVCSVCEGMIHTNIVKAEEVATLADTVMFGCGHVEHANCSVQFMATHELDAPSCSACTETTKEEIVV